MSQSSKYAGLGFLLGFLLPVVALTLLSLIPSTQSLKLIAVGDSITYGSQASDPATKSYPPVIYSMMLNNARDDEVVNLGVSGATMMKSPDGDFSYWDQPQYQTALNSNADIIVIQLGTNDAKTYQYNQETYLQAYNDMIKELYDANGEPRIYISIPPPLYEDNAYHMSQSVINKEFPVILRELAKSNKYITNYIDVFSALGGDTLANYEYFCNSQSCDACHPNDVGNVVMGAAIWKEVFHEEWS